MSFSTVRLTVIVLLGMLVLLFPADGLRALGLGEARVDSYLGQPLDVTIRLLDADSEAVDAMTVDSASPADHERVGLPSEALGLGLDITLDRSSDPPTVRVRSQRPANDPIVQILLDARFARGRVLREYTLFLDPPTIESPPPVRRAPEEVTERAPQPPSAEPAPREERPAPAQTPAPVDPEPAEERPRITDDSVTVARGDTLWSIGFNWRPDPDLSMDQVLLAIFERNRHAFIGENINRLRSDAELTMPSPDEVRELSRSEAEGRIREQMQAWQQAEPTRDVPVVADAGVPEADPVEPVTEPEEPEAEHRLDVVPPEDDEFADGPAVSEGEIRRIQGALADVEDEILAEQLESPEFDEQIAEIRDALESRDMAGVAFAEESLAELEASLREARREREEAEAIAETEEDEVVAYFDELERELVGESDETTPVPDEDPALAEVEETTDPFAADPADPAEEPTREEDVVVAEEPSPTEPDVQPMTTTPTSGGLLGLGLWQWLALAVLLIVVALVAAVVLMRRRQSAASESGLTIASAGDAEANARKKVARNPADLSAHLALLKLLASKDDESRFADAIDEMYQQVDDEEDERWQEALGLAMTHAPDHPLLTPNETPVESSGEDDDLARRTDQMLSMLDADEEDELQDDEFDIDSETPGSEEQALERELDDALTAPADEQDDDRGEGQDLGEDVDLADLSNRLDEPQDDLGIGAGFDDEDDDFDIGTFSEDEDDVKDSATAESDSDQGESPEKLGEDDLSLDFESDSLSLEEDASAAAAEDDSDKDIDIDEGLDFDIESELDTGDGAESGAESDGAEEAKSSTDDEFSLDFDSGDELDELSAMDSAPAEPDEESKAEMRDEDDETESLDSDLSLDLDDDPVDDLQAEADGLSIDDGDDAGVDDTEGGTDQSVFDMDEDFASEDQPEPEPDQPDSELDQLDFESDQSESEPDQLADPEISTEPEEAGGSQSDGEFADEAGLTDEDADVKLDLARAYMSVDLADSARTILEEVVSGGSPEKQDEARKLLEDL